jgi:hypothetical protein
VRRRAASRSCLMTPVTLSTCFTSARKAAWFLPGDLQQRAQQGRVGQGRGACWVRTLPSKTGSAAPAYSVGAEQPLHAVLSMPPQAGGCAPPPLTGR